MRTPCSNVHHASRRYSGNRSTTFCACHAPCRCRSCLGGIRHMVCAECLVCVGYAGHPRRYADGFYVGCCGCCFTICAESNGCIGVVCADAYHLDGSLYVVRCSCRNRRRIRWRATRLGGLRTAPPSARPHTRMFERCQLHAADSDSSCLYALARLESSQLQDLLQAPEPSLRGCAIFSQPGALCSRPSWTSAELLIRQKWDT